MTLQKNPVQGAEVTLHSTPQVSYTDLNGIAVFQNVEKGDHKILIAYSGFQGEQTINLDGDVKEFDITVEVKPIKVGIDKRFLGITSILIAIIAVQAFLLIRRRTERH